MATRRRGRRTQEERTAAMRTKLLEATVDCLIETGYAGTTTTAVVERAAVSRGAILHHFPTKADLVSTAVEHVMEKRLAAFRDQFAKFKIDENLVDSIIQVLWGEINGPIFYAWLELLVASRTDADLKKKVAPIAERWTENVDATFRDIFGIPRTADKHPLALAPIVTFMILEGLALERIARPKDPALEKRVLKALKTMAPLATLPSLAE
jgi:AcrR family transcriptional regulator